MGKIIKYCTWIRFVFKNIIINRPKYVSHTAQVVLLRYYTKNSMLKMDEYLMITSSIFLSCKMEDIKMNIKDVINMTYIKLIKQKGIDEKDVFIILF